jgi:hypothetical protein
MSDPDAVRRGSRPYRITTSVAVAVAVLAVIIVLRQAIFLAAGRILTISEPIAPADFIVMAQWDGEAAVLDAADLVHEGVSARVAILVEPSSVADRELKRRGVPAGNVGEYYARLLRGLGVAAVEAIATPADGTGSEGDVLAQWCDQQKLDSMIVVSTPDHSRRLRRILRRTMVGHRTRVLVHTTPYSDFDPNRWWETHEGVRYELDGLGKLVVDVVRHPF